MKKEIVLAILIGLSVGLVITYGVYIARNSLKKTPANPKANQVVTGSPSPDEASTLVILSPEDETVQTKKEVTVSGTTLPNSFVVIFVNDEETLTTADNSGNFSTATDLSPGSNIIAIHSLSEEGTETKAERTVIYATPSLTEAGGAISTASPSPSPETP